MNETKTNLTLKQRRRMAGQTAPEKSQREPSGNKEVSRVVGILILLLALGGGTALGMMYFKPDPRLQELDDLQALMADAGSDMPSDIRDMLQEQFQNVNDQLPTGERRRNREDFMFARAAKFYYMSAADQLADLQRQAAWEKMREERRAERELEAAAQGASANPSQASANGANGNNNGQSNGHGHRGHSDEQRAEHMEQHLAKRPPEQRGQWTLMHQMRTAVRNQMNQ